MRVDALDPDRVWQSREQARGIAIFCVGMSVVLALAALLPMSAGGRVFTLGMAALFGGGWFFWLRRAGVQLLADAVIVRNPFRMRSFPLADALEFSVGRWGFFPRIGLLHLRDGSVVHIWAIESANPMTRPRDRGAEDIVDQLNAILDAARDGSVPEQRGLRLKQS